MNTEPRRRTGLAVLAIAIAVPLAGALAVGAVTDSSFNQVRVVYDAAPLECADTDVSLWQDTSGRYHHAIDGSQGALCTLTFWVVNGGRTAVGIPAAGINGGGFLLKLNHVNPNGSGEVFEPSGDIPGEMMDVIALPPLTGGEEMQLSVAFETSTGLHTSGECSIISVNLPMVTLAKLGRERVVQPPEEQAISFVAGDVVECAEEWDAEEG